MVIFAEQIRDEPLMTINAFLICIIALMSLFIIVWIMLKVSEKVVIRWYDMTGDQELKIIFIVGVIGAIFGIYLVYWWYENEMEYVKSYVVKFYYWNVCFCFFDMESMGK